MYELIYYTKAWTFWKSEQSKTSLKVDFRWKSKIYIFICTQYSTHMWILDFEQKSTYNLVLKGNY